MRRKPSHSSKSHRRRGRQQKREGTHFLWRALNKQLLRCWNCELVVDSKAWKQRLVENDYDGDAFEFVEQLDTVSISIAQLLCPPFALSVSFFLCCPLPLSFFLCCALSVCVCLYMYMGACDVWGEALHKTTQVLEELSRFSWCFKPIKEIIRFSIPQLFPISKLNVEEYRTACEKPEKEKEKEKETPLKSPRCEEDSEGFVYVDYEDAEGEFYPISSASNSVSKHDFV